MPRKLKEIYLSNLLPDEPDSRDYTFSASVSYLPTKVDLRGFAGEIENQGATGSCVANATCSALEVLSEKANNYKDLSRFFLYYNLREPYSNLKDKDIGSYTRDGFKFANTQGICLETTWPFQTNLLNTKPSEECYTEALQYKAGKYERIQGFNYGSIAEMKSLKLMKAALAKGYPVLIGMQLGKTFYYIKGDIKEHKYMGVQADSIGGHAMNVVGYDDELDSFIVENSWSERWGDNGYCAIPYTVMMKDASDVWVCTEFMGQSFNDDWEDKDPHLTAETKLYKKDGQIYGELDILTGTPQYNIAINEIIFYKDAGVLEEIERTSDGSKMNIKYKFNFAENKSTAAYSFYITDNSLLEKDKMVYMTFTMGAIPEIITPEPEIPVIEVKKDKKDNKTKYIALGVLALIVIASIILV